MPHTYPGNVRELENLIERTMLLSTGPVIEVDDWLPNAACLDPVEYSRLEQFEREEILRLLKLHQGNLNTVAKNLGISRTTFWRRMKDYHIQADKENNVAK